MSLHSHYSPIVEPSEDDHSAMKHESTEDEDKKLEKIDDPIEILDDDMLHDNYEPEPEQNESNSNVDNANEEIDSMEKDENSESLKQCDDDKSDIILIEDTDHFEESIKMKSEEPTPTEEINENLGDSKEKLNVASRVSTDDELFEDAKESLDDIKEPEVEPETTLVQPPTITINSDDDSPIEVIKEDKVGRTKRDYSRRKHDTTTTTTPQSNEKRSDDHASEEASNSGSISSRLRMKDRDRSESPYVEEDSGEPSAKYKRRYSSTPIIDSLPNSPASSDDREYRSWKKSILLVYNSLVQHKYASIFSKPITEEQAPNYKTLILNPMDLQTLKRNIDSGTIRTTIEFQRYVMIMCYNAIFYNINDKLTCLRAKEMLTDALTFIEDFNETWKKENEKPVVPVGVASVTKAVRGRKSNRLMN